MAYTMMDDAAYDVQKNMRKEKIRVFLHNAKSFHHRLMARFLMKRGWVVFYLAKESRHCGDDMCWLALYEAEVKRNL